MASQEASQTADYFPRYTGTAKLTTERSPAQVLADIGAAASSHTHVEADITDLQSYLLNVVEDTTPQLGGTLDVNDNVFMDASGNTILGFTKNINADNYLSIANSQGNPYIEALGADTNVSIGVLPKGTGDLVLITGDITLSGANATVDGRDVSVDGATLDALDVMTAKGDLLSMNATPVPTKLTIGATNGHVLTVDSAEATGMKWAAAAGGGGNSFETIDCPLGTDPVADSSTDTLQLLSTDLDITGNATADSVTIDIKSSGVTTAKINDDAVTNAKISGRERTLYLEIQNPTATDVITLGYISQAATAIEIRGVTDTGTVKFKVEKRAFASPDVTGTELKATTTDAVAAGDTDSISVAVGADNWLTYVADSLVGAPTVVYVAVVYTVD